MKNSLKFAQTSEWASRLSTRAIELAQLQDLVSSKDSSGSDILSLLILTACTGTVFLFASPSLDHSSKEEQQKGLGEQQPSCYARFLEFLEEFSAITPADYLLQPSR